MVRIKAIIRLLRPKQWTKNLLVFAALIFTKSYGDPFLLHQALLAFAAMCLLSSAIYVLNDIFDAEKDRNHEKKKLRPIASGEVTIKAAWIVSALCGVIGAGISFAVTRGFVMGATAFLVVQLAYNLRFKHKPLADVTLISLGFVLRAALGAVAIRAEISGWLLFCTGSLALMLALAKRRHEFRMQGENRGESRPALAGYTQQAIDSLVLMSACLAAISYGVYSIESPTALKYPSLILTAPFVIYGVMRYLFIVFAYEQGGEPENLLLSDRHIIASVIGFLVCAFIAMSGFTLPFLHGYGYGVR